MTPLHVVCLCIAFILFALFWDAVWEMGIHRQWHHVWIGLVLVAQPWLWWLWPVGLYVMADDAYQHRRQMRDSLYLSPLHLLYERVYRLVYR